MVLPIWLEKLTSIKDVKDVLLNGLDCLIDRGEGLQRVRSPFSSEDSLSQALISLAFEFGARLDIASPMLDLSIGKLRLHMLLPHGICTSPSLSVRVHSNQVITLDELHQRKMISSSQLDVIRQSLEERKTIVISGATSSGKTTLLRAMLAECQERVVTIEQIPELFLTSPAVSLTARENNQEGVGQITLSDLVVQSLRMRPDRVVVGEVRRDEFIAFLQAVSNGHPGSLTTLHASSINQVPQRLILLGLLSGVSAEVTAQLVASTIDLVLQLDRQAGARQLVAIAKPVLIDNQLQMVM
ncbi:MAG: Flp pilus assembly complex ATPase component TadA [Actinomycetota bacterium]